MTVAVLARPPSENRPAGALFALFDLAPADTLQAEIRAPAVARNRMTADECPISAGGPDVKKSTDGESPRESAEGSGRRRSNNGLGFLIVYGNRNLAGSGLTVEGDPNAGKPRSTDSPPELADDSALGKVKNGLGFLLAAFAALLNVLGLQSSELSSVLRNEPRQAAIAASLLAGALAAAAASIFIPNKTSVSAYWIPVTAACLVGMTALVIDAIRIPGVSSGADGELAGFSAGGLVLATVAAVAVVRRHKKTPRASVTSILLICSVILLSLAGFAAARVETSSQVNSTHPQISAVIRQADSRSTVSISFSASKLRDEEQIGIVVRGVPRAMDLSARCKGSPRVDTCLVSKVCAYQDDPCEMIASGPLKPDATGAVKADVEVPFPVSAYQFIDIRATLCQLDAGSQNCKYRNKDAVLFLSVPPAPS
ncbi:hypothetical protein ACFWIQ_24380 [Kitasatospora sp. NPDC127059]|uniref:hypothetical protein n=1 Tax=unclassified Kitasatospora TaxID=2633591 RepID=UPI00364B4AC8